MANPRYAPILRAMDIARELGDFGMIIPLRPRGQTRPGNARGTPAPPTRPITPIPPPPATPTFDRTLYERRRKADLQELVARTGRQFTQRTTKRELIDILEEEYQRGAQPTATQVPKDPRTDRNIALRHLLRLKGYQTHERAKFTGARQEFWLTLDPNTLAEDILNHRYYFGYALVRRTPLDTILHRPDAPQVLSAVLEKILGGNPRYGNFNDHLALVWWLYLYEAPIKVPPGRLSWLLEQPLESLREVAGDDYSGPDDYPHVFFALLTHGIGDVAPMLSTAYERFRDENPGQLLDRARCVYGYYLDSPATASSLTVYDYMAIQNPRPVEPFFYAYIAGANVADLARAVGMIIPPETSPRRYFFHNLSKYSSIFLRPEGQTPPPPNPRTSAALRMYTDQELLDAYEPNVNAWESREDLLSKIIEEIQAGPLWRITSRHCNNDDRINIGTGGPRDKDNPEDPILSYGVPGDYRCYNLSELLMVWREYEDGFRFAVPDYLKGDPIRDFPVSSIRQLQNLLGARLETQPIFWKLFAVITQGLHQLREAGRRVLALRRTYREFTPAEQGLVDRYLVWLFHLGMTMRYWPGPGTPYPHEWLEATAGARCDPVTRDANVIREFTERTRLLEEMERLNPELARWVLDLPRVRYDFRTGDATLGRETINYIITESQRGNFCLAEVSDLVLQTSYYLIRGILDLATEADFNAYIARVTGVTNQPPFQPHTVQGTHHVDPYHRLQEE